jgi:sigma-E factor negative regulatory protein RseA
MTEVLREQLSALADDELDRREVELLLLRYGEQAELRACWHRYHVIGEAIRLGLPEIDVRGLADRVGAALDEPLATGGTERRWLRVLRPVGAAAVAASVSLVAILLLRGQNPAAPAPTEVVPVQTRLQVPNIDYRAVSGVRWDQGSPQVRRELNEYLFDHNEDVPALGRQGMLPYVHLATFYAAEPATVPDRPPRDPRR